jgi:hypothetical protein
MICWHEADHRPWANAFSLFTLGRMAMTNTLAIIAAGAMAARSHDAWPRMARVLTSLKGRSQATAARAHQAGMISASDEEIAATACSQSVGAPVAVG